MHNKINIRNYQALDCPVYVLDARLQGASFIPKWDKQVRVGAYIGRSPIHAGNVSLILNLSTGHVSPQFHVLFDETFSTVPSLKNGSVPSSWSSFAKIIENSGRTKISIWQIYGKNLSGKMASNSTSKRTQLTKVFNNQKIMH